MADIVLESMCELPSGDTLVIIRIPDCLCIDPDSWKWRVIQAIVGSITQKEQGEGFLTTSLAGKVQVNRG